MSKFDSTEQKIYDTISQINVDSSKLAGQVKSRLHEDVPNFNSPHRSRWTKSAVAAIAMSAVLVVTAAAAVLGGFDWFIEKINPPFSEIVEPVEVYSEDQGIRMEVIGAQKYDNMAIVYLSLQDISGQNRLTDNTDFKDGFNVKMNPSVIETTGQTEEIISSSFSWNQEMLYFDKDTNTIYYEFNITADPDSPLADPLELSSFLIYFDEKAYKDELIPVSLAEIDEAEITPITEEYISVEGHLFEHINLSPLGLQVIGSYEGEECLVSDMSVAIETSDDIISLEYGGGSQNPEKQSFSSSWKTKSPIDISKVTAVILNDVRIPIK